MLYYGISDICDPRGSKETPQKIFPTCLGLDKPDTTLANQGPTPPAVLRPPSHRRQRLHERLAASAQDLYGAREHAHLRAQVRHLRALLLVRIALAAQRVDVALEVVALQDGLAGELLDLLLLFGDLLLDGVHLVARVVQLVRRRLLLAPDDGGLRGQERAG